VGAGVSSGGAGSPCGRRPRSRSAFRQRFVAIRYSHERREARPSKSARLERDGVPAAAIAWNTSRDFFSARIGCQVYQPYYGMDIAALCLRD
jgi:hypothetical protein